MTAPDRPPVDYTDDTRPLCPADERSLILLEVETLAQSMFLGETRNAHPSRWAAEIPAVRLRYRRRATRALARSQGRLA